MAYYNQYNYKNTLYPHASRPTATIASSGCGVCAMSMIVEGLTDQTVTPPAMAKFSIAQGARASSGTDMAKLAKAAAKQYGLICESTSDVKAMQTALRQGAWVIANVGGDRAGYTGLFSDGGHYVVVRGTDGARLIVWDPGLYQGKYAKNGRANKVTVKGEDIYVLPAYLDQDCSNRAPRYYIFYSEDDMVKRYKTVAELPKELRAEAQQLVDAGALKGKGGAIGLDVTEDMIRSMIIIKRYVDSQK